jgi:hypothetical protein
MGDRLVEIQGDQEIVVQEDQTMDLDMEDQVKETVVQEDPMMELDMEE